MHMHEVQGHVPCHLVQWMRNLCASGFAYPLKSSTASGFAYPLKSSTSTRVITPSISFSVDGWIPVYKDAGKALLVISL